MMKKYLSPLLAVCLMLTALCAPASALDYDFTGPDSGLFGTPTTDSTVYVAVRSDTNIDRSKNAALIPPRFGSPTSYTLNAGELLTPNLVNQPAQLTGTAGYTTTGVTIMPPTTIATPSNPFTLADTSASTNKYTRYTSVTSDLYYSGGHLGTLSVPAISLTVKVYQGTDNATLAKGAGHFSDTSVWDGNVAIAAHNRGVNNHFGKIHTLNMGDKITYTTKLGTRSYYTVKETIAPAGYMLDSTEHSVYVDTYNPATTDDPRITVSNRILPMLRIVKYDAQTKKPLPDTTFAVYRDTELIGQYTTSASGEIYLYDLAPGTYTVKELSTPNTHVVNSTPQEIELEAGEQNYTLVFLNYLKPGIHLTKLDSQTYAPLTNARFKVSQVGGTFNREYLTDANGEVDLTALDPGSYTVEELAAPEGYLIDDYQRIIKINEGENASFVFTDTKKPVLSVMKYDVLREKMLPGATFRIAKIEDGSHYLDRITDTQGSITIENLDPGVYSVQEIDAPSGYIINEMEYHVQLFPGQTSQLVVCDDKKPDMKIVKKDADTGAVLAGATFKVNRADGSTLTTEQTDANGEIFLKELDPGVYQITEVSPPTGYLPAEQPTQLVTLEPNKLGTVIFENHIKPTLTVNKIDSVTGAALKGAKFHVTYTSNQTFSGEINDLGNFYTDDNGQFVISELKDGWYKVTELEPPAGYAIKDPATQEFYILAGKGKAVTFENTPLSALCVFKYDSVTGEAVKNAVFQVKYLSGTSGTGGTVIGRYVTSANGSFTVTGLAKGTYIVEEIASDSGHIIDTAPQTAFISGEQQDVVRLHFGNAPKGEL